MRTACWVVILLTLIACDQSGPVADPAPPPKVVCYLLDADGGYLLDGAGNRLTCDGGGVK